MPFSEYEGDQPSDWWKLGRWWDKEKEKRIRPEILLRQVAPNTFQLARGFRYALPAEDDGAGVSHFRRAAWYLWGRQRGRPRPTQGSTGPWDVPPHDLLLDPRAAENSTDLASVPPWLWWFIASHGRHSRAALLHDHLIGPNDDDVTDKQADHAFRMALRDSGVRTLRRWIMWNGVSLASLWRESYGKVSVAVFVFHIAAFAGTLAFAMYSSWDWLGEALAYPFVWVWDNLFLDKLVTALGAAIAWLWSSADWILPSAFEEPWWKVAIVGLTGLLVWRKRWLITLAGLTLISLPTVAVFLSYALTFSAETALSLVTKAASKIPKLKIPADSMPEFGRPYRKGIGRM
jgi:uncharacterized protein DUF1353